MCRFNRGRAHAEPRSTRRWSRDARRRLAVGAALAALRPAPALAQDWLEMKDTPPTRDLSLVAAALRSKGSQAQLHALLGLTATSNDGFAVPRPMLQRFGSRLAFALGPRRWLSVRTETELGVTVEAPVNAGITDVAGSHELRGRFALTQKESRASPVFEATARAFVRHGGRLGGMMLDSQVGRRPFWDAGAELGVFGGGAVDRSVAAGLRFTAGWRTLGFSARPLGETFPGQLREAWLTAGAGFVPKSDDAVSGVANLGQVEVHHYEFTPGTPAYVRPMLRIDVRVLDASDVVLPISKREFFGATTSFGWSVLQDGAVTTDTPVFRFGLNYVGFWDRIDGWAGGAISRELVPLADGSGPIARTRFEGTFRANLKKERIGFGATHVLEHRQLWVPGRPDGGDKGFVFALGAEAWGSPIRSLVDLGLVYTGGNNCAQTPVLGNGGACHQFGGFVRLRVDSRVEPGRDP